MLGFVSALSSTVAILIIVVAMSMLNSFLHVLEEQKKYTAFTSIQTSGDNTSGDNVVNYLISQGSIMPINAILNIVDDKSVIFITCTYGKNFSKKVADDFLLFNFIKIKANLPNREVKANLVLEKNKNNNCRLGE